MTEVYKRLTDLEGYVDYAETIICGEWHLFTWPDCDHRDHNRGKELLAMISAEKQEIK